MSPTERLTAEDRKKKIVEAAMPVFAKKGFAASTTKEIAKAARVSEALLYKHFKSKDELYREMFSLCGDESLALADGIVGFEPSTRSLVLGVYFLVRQIFLGFPGQEAQNDMLKRLLARSLLEDGRFAREFFDLRFKCYIPKIEEFLKAAAAAGDLSDGKNGLAARIWFAHHLPVILGLTHLPGVAVVDYGLGGEQLMDQATLFVLRGLGLKEEAIRAHFDPKAIMAWLRDSAGTLKKGK